MPIDFGKLGSGDPVDTVLHPREIFSVLPTKATRYQYPRDVQTEVWNGWFDRRTESELVVKMNTGSGKTVVGLLILKSCLNEKKGPAVYVCPDPYLVGQVIQEARDLGIEVTENEDDARFRRGQAILVINIYKLINGKSTFGVGAEGVKIRIGSIVVDDVHACLNTTLGQFTLTASSSDELYKNLFVLFKEELSRQSEASALEVEQSYPGTNMLVPYWAWSNNISKVTQILNEARETESAKFVWPLIKEDVALCNCVFGEGKVEISLRCQPVGVIPAFVGAGRKIYMTATLSDDSILLTHFNATQASVRKPITPSAANDIGDRMILVPQELNRDTSDDAIKALLVSISKRHNIVVIVPSNFRARYWHDVAQMTLTSGNLQEGVQRLKQGHVGLVVMVNRYDGIDLPQNACRILVIDGLPDVRRKIERIEQAILDGSEQVTIQFIQRIEQGMGRGIRSNEDYCVVVLMGRSLIRMLYADDALAKFTPATRSQLTLSEKLSEQLRGKPVGELEEVMNYCLKRDRQWVSASKGALVHLKYDSQGSINPLAESLRQAFDAAEIRDYQKAVDILQAIVNSTTDRRVKGWLKQQLAGYLHNYNPVQSQQALKSALEDNRLLLRPIEGITYVRLMTIGMNQANQCSDYLVRRYGNANKIVLAMNGLLEELVFTPDTAPRFEEAMKQLAFFLGFKGQRPENEFGKGPDNLWEVGSLKYLVIEDKNGATGDTISKHDCNQLAGSMNWFGASYDASCQAVPILVHPSNIFERACSPHPDTRIIDAAKLPILREACRSLATSLAAGDTYRNPTAVAELLHDRGLTADLIVPRFTEKYRVKS